MADGALSFDSMLYVGAIADVAEGKGLGDDVLELSPENKSTFIEGGFVAISF
ncbi:hypothetical protein ACNO7T_21575 [Vibrio campbellii]